LSSIANGLFERGDPDAIKVPLVKQQMLKATGGELIFAIDILVIERG